MVLHLHHAQRIDVRDQVAAHAVRVDQLEHPGLFLDLDAASFAAEGGIAVARPVERLVRDAQILERLLVELALAQKQLLDRGQEGARFRSLDDAVVVRRRERHDLADRQLREGLGAHGAKLRRILHGAGGHDHALAGHQAGHRGGRSERAGVGQRKRRAFEVAHLELALARPTHDVVGRRHELREAHRVGALDVGHEQSARPVGLLDVHGQAEVHSFAANPRGRPARRVVGVVQLREVLQRPQDGPGDQMGERDLSLVVARPPPVDEPPVLVEQLDRSLPLRGRGRDLEARLHVLGDPQSSAPDGLPLLARPQGPRRLGGWNRRRRRRGDFAFRLPPPDFRPVPQTLPKEVAPLFVHRLGVGPKPRQQIGDVARVLAEFGDQLLARVHVGPGGHGGVILASPSQDRDAGTVGSGIGKMLRRRAGERARGRRRSPTHPLSPSPPRLQEAPP